MTYRRICPVILILALFALPAVPAPNTNDGVEVLFMLCDPIGANTGLLWNNFERLGWDVTVTGTHEVVGNCNYVTTSITVGTTLASIGGLGTFDVLAISPTPGSYRSVSSPASDLRESVKALRLIQQADAAGLTLYAGCSSLLVLAEAGILDGRDVVCHSTLRSECEDTGASCSTGSFRTPPKTDGNLVTGTNQRYFALEIPEAIARSLDDEGSFERSLDLLLLEEIELAWLKLDPSDAVTSAVAVGTPRSDLAYDACALEDGFVIAGQTYAGDQGNSNALVIRFDEDAQPLWSSALGGPGRDVAHSVCATSDGGIAVAGLTTSAGGGSEDLLLFKLSANGALLWTKTYGGAEPDAGFGLCETSNGDLVITGYTHLSDGAFSALQILRVDAGGEEIWSSVYDGGYYERGHSIIELPDGTLMIAGGTASIGTGNYDLLLAAYSASGDLLWIDAYGRASYDIAEQVILTRSGDLVAAGFGDIDGSDPNSAIITRIDGTGQRIWFKRNGSRLSFDYAQAVIELDSGGFLLCGATTGEETGRNDVWLFSLSEDGGKLWEQRYGSDSGNEWANALCRIADGRIVSVGWTRSHGAGSHDVLVMFVNPSDAI